MTSLYVLLALFAVALAGETTKKFTEYGADFDYFMLTLQYPTDNCQADNDQKEDSCEIPVGTSPWTIHGLWPNFENGSYPQNCRGNPQKFDPSQITSIENKLSQVWPNILVGKGKTSFWKHEYEKHGTCSQSDPLFDTELKYFEESMRARTLIDIASVLSPIGPSDEPVKKSDVQRLIKEAIGGYEFQLHCLRDHKLNAYLLSDIRICLTKNLKFRDCPLRGSKNRVHERTKRSRHHHGGSEGSRGGRLPTASECPATFKYLKEEVKASSPLISFVVTIAIIAFSQAFLF